MESQHQGPADFRYRSIAPRMAAHYPDQGPKQPLPAGQSASTAPPSQQASVSYPYSSGIFSSSFDAALNYYNLQPAPAVIAPAEGWVPHQNSQSFTSHAHSFEVHGISTMSTTRNTPLQVPAQQPEPIGPTERPRASVCQNCCEEFIPSQNRSMSCRKHKETCYAYYPEGYLWPCCGRQPNAPGCMSDFHVERKEIGGQKEQVIGNFSSENVSLEQMELEQASSQTGHQANNFDKFMSSDEGQVKLNDASAQINDESCKAVGVSDYHAIEEEQMVSTEANGQTYHGVGSPVNGDQTTHATELSDEELVPTTQEVNMGSVDVALNAFSSQKKGLESLSGEDFDRLWDD